MRYLIRYGDQFVSGTGPLKFSAFPTSAMTFSEERKDEVLALLKLYTKNDYRARDIRVEVCGSWSEANQEQANARMERKAK